MELKFLKEQIKEEIKKYGYDLISFSFNKIDGNDTLSIVVDRVEEIDMNAIVDLSNKINSFLDVLNPFEKSYNLDISSLGAEKPLKIEDLKNYVNRYINVHINNPIEGENIFEGELSKVEDDLITLSYKIKTRNKTVDILKTNISKIRLAIKL